MKSLLIRSSFLLFFVFITNVLYSQEEIYDKLQQTSVYESINDSIDLASNFYSFYDSLAIYFEGDTLYNNFDNDNIHYPKVDFSKKTDTTLIYLTDNSKNNFYFHPFKGEVTSRFGMRHGRYHYGTDVNLETGDSVLNVFDGIVRITKLSRSYGFVVVVRHLNGLETLYAHLSQINVYNNQIVKAGEIIGLGGNTGRSRGSHLHFEIRYLGAPINPEDIIDFQNLKLHSDVLSLCAYHFRYQKDISKLKEAKFYKVKRGDSLGSIARKFHTNVKVLKRLNGLRKSTIIRAGKSIRVR